MRKRSKKRIPQDVLPWVRVASRAEDELHIFKKKTTRWFSGSRRDAQTRHFISQAASNGRELMRSIYLKELHTSSQKSRSEVKNLYFDRVASSWKLLHALEEVNNRRLLARSRPKNFCLMLGKGRTYSRDLFISRQALRKLAKTGLISGLTK